MINSDQNKRLVGNELIEFLKEHQQTKGLDEIIALSGYTTKEAFRSMLARASGKYPVSIRKGDEGDEWREAMTSLCSMVPLEIKLSSFAESTVDQSAETIRDNCLLSIVNSLYKSVKYNKALAHSCLRRYTYSFFAAQAYGNYNEKKFDENFDLDIFVFIQNEVLECITDDEAKADFTLANSFSGYIQQMAQIFTNHFANLLGNEPLEVIPEEHEYFIKWKIAHRELEDKGCFDEIFIIRLQLVNAFIAVEGSMLMNTEASNLFQIRAMKLLRTFDTKPIKNTEIADQKLIGWDLLETFYRITEGSTMDEVDRTMVDRIMSKSGYDFNSESELKAYLEALNKAELDFMGIVDTFQVLPDKPLIGEELLDKFNECKSTDQPVVLTAVVCGYFEKTPSGKVNVFIQKLIANVNKDSINATQQLTGEALLLKVKELVDVSKTELVLNCGYIYGFDNNGTPIPDSTRFYEALLAAKSTALSSSKREDLLSLVDSLKAANPKIDSYDLAELAGYTSASELASDWYLLVYGDQSIETPILALDAYLVDAPIYVEDELESQIIDWCKQEVLEPLHMQDFFEEAGTSFLEVIKGGSKAFKLSGDMNASQYGNLWRKATIEYWRIGELPNAFTCNQAISAVARFIVNVSETFESPKITPIIEDKTN